MNSGDIQRLLANTWVASVEHHRTLASTNDRAAELAKQTETELPLLVIADEQTAGRGRGGNRWWTGEGSLAFSVLFDSLSNSNGSSISPLQTPIEEWSGKGQVRAESPLNIPLVGLAAGLAVIEAVRPIVENLVNRKIGLHWPNDVFVDDRKLAGILTEILPDRKTVLGIGANINNSTSLAPLEIRSKVTSLLDLTGMKHDRISILISILNHLQGSIEMMKKSPKDLAAAADIECMQKGKLLQLQWGTTVHSGICRGIDPSGAILLESDNELRAFPSGVILKS